MFPSPCGGSSWQDGRGVRGRRGAEPAGLRLQVAGQDRQVCPHVPGRTGRFACRAGRTGRFAWGDAGGVGRWRGEHSHGSDARPPRQRPPAAAGPGRGSRPGHRARRRVPRRPAGSLRPRSGRAGPRRQGRARATASSSSATTTSATRSSSSPTSPATPSSWPRRRPHGRTRRTSSSAACTSWPSRPTSSPTTGRPVILPDLAAGLLDGRHGRRSARSRTRGTTWSTPGVADDDRAR